MPKSHEVMRSIARQMLSEELLLILGRIKEGGPLTLLQSKVFEEAERRRLI